MEILKSKYTNGMSIIENKYYICTRETDTEYYLDLSKYGYNCDQAIYKAHNWFIELDVNLNIWKILYV